MNKKSIILILGVFVLVAAIVVGWNVVYPTQKFRYKVTVNVETPEGFKSGYAIRELEVRQQPEIADSRTWSFVHGEAVVVDLGQRGLLFALVSEGDRSLVFKSFPYERGGLTRAGMRIARTK